MTVQEDQILKVQLFNGRVWYADGVESPAESIQDLTGFINEVSHRTNPHIRVLGTVSNSQLIVDLYQKCCSPRRNGKLEVASPLVCLTAAERNDPNISLYRMRQCLLSPSLGGWHQVTELDYPVYALAAQFNRDGVFNEHIQRLLQTHPVYHDLTFLPTLHQESIARLLAIVLDPRWFIDFSNPYRLSRLKTYLGLTPRYMWNVTNGIISNERAHRCFLTLKAWQGDGEPNPRDYELPGNFLWRRWKSVGGSFKGNLRATQAFVAYLARTWQQRLVAKSTQRLEKMFDPEGLLKGSEVDAYKHHERLRQPC